MECIKISTTRSVLCDLQISDNAEIGAPAESSAQNARFSPKFGRKQPEKALLMLHSTIPRCIVHYASTQQFAARYCEPSSYIILVDHIFLDFITGNCDDGLCSTCLEQLTH